MKDILGREIKIGDIVAHGTRSGNSGDLNIKIIADKKLYKEQWSGNEIEKLKVINYTYIDKQYNTDLREWEPVEPHYEKGGIGWSTGYCMLVINESVPDELRDFLRSLV